MLLHLLAKEEILQPFKTKFFFFTIFSPRISLMEDNWSNFFVGKNKKKIFKINFYHKKKWLQICFQINLSLQNLQDISSSSEDREILMGDDFIFQWNKFVVLSWLFFKTKINEFYKRWTEDITRKCNNRFICFFWFLWFWS